MSFLTFLRQNAPFLIVGVLLTFSSAFGQTFFISVFAGQIRSEFNLSNGDWGLIYSAGTAASALLMIGAGVATDRIRVRYLGPLVIGLLAVACIAMANVSGVISLILAIFALRFLGQGMSILVATVAMARWFVASRGKALSVAAIGVETGAAFLPLIFVAAMDSVPWRTLWVTAGIVLLCIAPILWPLLRLERTPSSIASDPQTAGMAGRNWTRAAMLRHPLYWCLVPALLAPAAFSTAFFFHQVHFADTKGWMHVGLVSLFPAFTAAGMAMTFGSGWIIDRIGTARLMPIFQLPMALGFIGFAFAPTLAWAVPCLALMGLTQGANSTVPNAFWAEFYGTRHMGGIRSLAAAVMVFGTAIGPALTGILIDLGIPFEDQLFGIALYFVFAAVMVQFGIGRARSSLAGAS